METDSRVDMIGALSTRRILLVLCFISSIAILSAGYFYQISKLPAEISFSVPLPVSNNEDFATFCRKCFFDPIRIGSLIANASHDHNAITATLAVSQDTSELFTTSIASIQKLTSSPTGMFAKVSLMPREIALASDTLYQQFVERAAIPAVACHAWMRALAKIDATLQGINSRELLSLPDYHFYKTTLKNRIKYLKQSNVVSEGNARTPGIRTFHVIPVGRLAVPSGTQLLSKRDQEAVLNSTLSDIDGITAYSEAFVAANHKLMKALKSVEISGSIDISMLSTSLDQAANKDDAVYELLQSTKAEFEDTVDRFAKESTKTPELITNIRYRPKIRHLVIIAAVAGLASIFLTLFIVAYQGREETKA